MLRRSIYFLFVAFLQAPLNGAEIGEPAPRFDVIGRDGASYASECLEGRIVVLESFNRDCPYCANHFKTGAMQELQERYVDRGVVWLVVNSTHRDHDTYRDPEQALEDWRTWGLHATDYIDDHRGQLARAFGFKVTPQFAIIDSRGVLAYTGAVDDRPSTGGDPREARNYVVEALEALLAEKPVRIPRTRPYGCGIKW